MKECGFFYFTISSKRLVQEVTNESLTDAGNGTQRSDGVSQEDKLPPLPLLCEKPLLRSCFELKLPLPPLGAIAKNVTFMLNFVAFAFIC
jgi:hypothetical protein